MRLEENNRMFADQTRYRLTLVVAVATAFVVVIALLLFSLPMINR